MSGRPWRKDLYRLLLNYRATPHSTTGFPPATLLFNRTINTKLPQPTSQNRSKMHQQARLNDASQKQKMKENADNKRRARNTDIEEGDTVLLRQPKKNKLSTKYDAQPYMVIAKKGTKKKLKEVGEECVEIHRFSKRLRISIKVITMMIIMIMIMMMIILRIKIMSVT